MTRGALVAICLMLLLGASGCVWFFSAVGNAFEMCGNTVRQTVLSPDGTLKAVSFERDCGATTGFSEQTSLLRRDDALPNTSGNIFQADGGAPGDDSCRVVWRDNNTLQVMPAPHKRVYWKVTSHDVPMGWLGGKQRVRIMYP